MTYLTSATVSVVPQAPRAAVEQEIFLVPPPVPSPSTASVPFVLHEAKEAAVAFVSDLFGLVDARLAQEVRHAIDY